MFAKAWCLIGFTSRQCVAKTAYGLACERLGPDEMQNFSQVTTAQGTDILENFLGSKTDFDKLEV